MILEACLAGIRKMSSTGARNTRNSIASRMSGRGIDGTGMGRAKHGRNQGTDG